MCLRECVDPSRAHMHIESDEDKCAPLIKTYPLLDVEWLQERGRAVWIMLTSIWIFSDTDIYEDTEVQISTLMSMKKGKLNYSDFLSMFFFLIFDFLWLIAFAVMLYCIYFDPALWHMFDIYK